ncbi:MAG: hypothetical protein MJE77_02515 [Proteobacteria bacterium]|nr:hypothetical protein [Pseudomonadota bacterium]
MMRRVSLHGGAMGAALVCGVALVLMSSSARADWPLPRGDKARTGKTTGVASLHKPVPFWRYYLGGSVDGRGSLVMDIDRDGSGEVLVVSGGKLIAVDRDNVEQWETPVLGLSRIIALADFDGDGAGEIAVHGMRQAFVIEPATGAVLWEQPSSDFGTFGGARVGDLDGDGRADLFVQECACCRVSNGNTGFVYSFADGFDSAKKLWTLPSVLCGGYRSMAILDIDGDGRSEVTLGQHRRIVVLDGATGQMRAISAELGERVGGSICRPADVDGDGDHELVCAQGDNPVEKPELGHRIFALDYRTGAGVDQFGLLWLRQIGDQPRSMVVTPDYTSDIDGDGRVEIAVSGVVAASGGERAATFILDAASGAVLAEIADHRMAGVVFLRAGDSATVLTENDGALHAWLFTRGSSPARRWSLADRRPAIEPDWDLARTIYGSNRIVALDLTGDGISELVTRSTSAANQLYVYDVSGAGRSDRTPGEFARYTAGHGDTILAIWTADVSSDKSRLLVAPSSGIMRLLDRELQPLGFGIRFGGYYPQGDWRNLHLTPVVADLSSDADMASTSRPDSVIVSDSSGSLVRIDGSTASLAVKLDATWRLPGTTSPIVVPGLAGQAPGIACRQSADDGDHRVAVLDPDGQTRWSADVGGRILSDLVPAGLSDDGVPDLIVQWGLRSDRVLEHTAYSGATGEVLWNAQPHREGTTRFPAGGAVTDWNGDGVDDFVHQFYETRVLSGLDGSVLARNDSDELAYFMPTVVDVDRDDRDEVVLHGSFYPVRVVDDDLVSTLWQSAESDRPYPYGAVATTCYDRVPRLVEGSMVHPSRLKITPLSGGELGVATVVFLAGGKAFTSEAQARESGLRMGQLTSTSLHENLMGDARPMAVVGSDDGWLYAVHACTGSLEFSVPFGVSVGAIAFGDSNGDGLDEIIVAAADGYVYALWDAAVDAPQWIIDTDPSRGIVDSDIDITEQTAVLSAAWQAIPEADGYEIAILRAESNEFLTDPPWRKVGLATEATVTHLQLELDERYTFAVRALKDGARSPDAASDGVRVQRIAVSGGCACDAGRVGSSGSHGWSWTAGWLFLAWFVWRRRQSLAV